MFFVFFRNSLFSITLESPVRRALSLSLVPTQLSCPHFSLRGFFGQVFNGLRLTAFVSVVSGSSALLVFSLFCFPVSYLMYLFGVSQSI